MDGEDLAQQMADVLAVLIEQDVGLDCVKTESLQEKDAHSQGIGLAVTLRDGSAYTITVSCERYPRWLVEAENDAIRKEPWELTPWRYRR